MKKFKENIFPIPRQDFSYSDTSSEHQRSSRLTPKPSYIRIIHLKSFILLKLKLSMSDSDTSENQTRPKSFD
jgi:hypothetical protein